MVKDDEVKETAVQLFVDSFYLETSIVYHFDFMFKQILLENQKESIVNFYLDMAFYTLTLIDHQHQ